MITKVNILIDGGFFWQCFKKHNKRNPKPKDVVSMVSYIMDMVKVKTNGDTTDILFRVFYYDCRPFGDVIELPDGKQIDYSASKGYEDKNKYLDALCQTERFALRLGELSFTGWKHDPFSKKLKPDFKQKSVDMKFGLDMAVMATKHTVDKIVLVAGDSDFITPIKYARTEGLQIYLYPMGNHIKQTLRGHCDFVIK
ncbi:MAG: NYN domain-containing protein [Alistipes sp.]|nr:NYN domain-containing protein [Alistipes sp.]